jgi:hypothetical protein
MKALREMPFTCGDSENRESHTVLRRVNEVLSALPDLGPIRYNESAHNAAKQF